MIEDCKRKAPSKDLLDHIHTCTGNHQLGDDHLCPECGRRWYRKPAKVRRPRVQQ